jgi:hypothetical protein
LVGFAGSALSHSPKSKINGKLKAGVLTAPAVCPRVSHTARTDGSLGGRDISKKLISRVKEGVDKYSRNSPFFANYFRVSASPNSFATQKARVYWLFLNFAPLRKHFSVLRNDLFVLRNL